MLFRGCSVLNALNMEKLGVKTHNCVLFTRLSSPFFIPHACPYFLEWALLNNKRIKNVLGFWMVRILSPFGFQKIYCVKALEALSQCLYRCIRYCWVWVKQFSIRDIGNKHKFKKLLASWMFRESFSFVRACIIDGFDMN